MGAAYPAEDSKLKRRAVTKTTKPELVADGANRDRFERRRWAGSAPEAGPVLSTRPSRPAGCRE